MNPNHHIEPAQDCDAIRELIPEYAFGLTSPDDTRLVESNLANCPESAADLADFLRLQDEMRADVPQIEPPAQLLERLMAASAPAVPEVKPSRRVLPLAWLAAAAAVLALVITNVYWMSRVDDLSRRQDELAARLGGQDSNAFVLTGTADLRWVRLPPDQEGADTSAFLMWNAESAIGLLYVRGFPALSSGKTYQLWLTRGEERVDAGTFQVDEEGNSALLFHIPDAIDEYTWARITEEPESGSNEPTGTVIVHGELQG